MPVDAVLIAGPTASGKTAAALALAGLRPGILIVNADSMQVYRELRILTARPSRDEEALAPHALFGHVPVWERYSAGRYAREAAAVLARAREENRLPVFVGGTGLYFWALSEGIAEIPPVPADVRASVRALHARLGSDAFHAELARRDPETAARLSPSDTQRLLRAMDVAEATGTPLSEWQRAPARPVLEGLRLARILLAPPREELYARIGARFDAMLAQGALDEVRALGDLDPALPAARALGVTRLRAHLAGELPIEEAVSLAKQDSRRYAKRQLTWFRRRMAGWTWYENFADGNIIAELTRVLA